MGDEHDQRRHGEWKARAGLPLNSSDSGATADGWRAQKALQDALKPQPFTLDLPAPKAKEPEYENIPAPPPAGPGNNTADDSGMKFAVTVASIALAALFIHNAGDKKETVSAPPRSIPMMHDATPDAQKAYAMQLNGFFQEQGANSSLSETKKKAIANSLSRILASKPLNHARYAYSVSGHETVTIASAPAAYNGNLDSLVCMSDGDRITSFGLTQTFYRDASNTLSFKFQRSVYGFDGSKVVDISKEVEGFPDCGHAFSHLKAHYFNLPELGSSYIVAQDYSQFVKAAEDPAPLLK
jgi:hypothetical protein